MSDSAGKNEKAHVAAIGNPFATANAFIQSASAFAAATAVGIGFQRQFANAMLGFFEAALTGAKLEGKVAEAPAAVAETVAVAPQPFVETTVIANPAVEEAKPKVVVAKMPAAKTKAPAVTMPQMAVAEPVRKTRVTKDDLKLLSGIGPKLEEVLNGKGIRRLADIAGWSEDDIRRIDAELGLNGRIGRDDWAGQAKAITAGRKART